MDKVKNAIKCVECMQILESPVLLPCSHSICDKHVRVDGKTSMKCRGCGIEHKIPKNTGFPRNQALEEIIVAKIGALDFGKTHVQAKEHCEKLDALLKSMKRLESDPSAYAGEEIKELRNRVNVKSEKLKQSIDQKTEELLNSLKEYEKKCTNLLSSIKKVSERQKSTYDELRKKAQSDLESWQNELNDVKFDESRWYEIINESKRTIRNLEIALRSFKTGLLLGEDNTYKLNVELFENINIDNNRSRHFGNT